MTQPRILFVQPNLNPPGGASSVAAFALQALRDSYDIELLSWEPIAFAEIDRFYGTRLSETRFVTHGFSPLLRRLLALDPDPHSFQRVAFLIRRAKQMRNRYHLLASFCDEIDFGRTGLQYIHYPYFEGLYRETRTPGTWWNALRLRCRPFQLISGFRFETMKQNVTLVNSNWTGERMRRAFGIPSRTVYPPVVGDFPSVPWEAREDGFVSIGRISPEKRLEDNIHLVRALRAQGHSVHFHIIGTRGHPNAEPYYCMIASLVKEYSDWVTLHENLSRVEMYALVSKHRYGLHGMPGEHFGLAPAEMIRGGCIVFVPNSGGQVEIVGGNNRLTYASAKEAVDKIARVLKNETMQRDLQSQLAARADLFSAERFMCEIRNVFDSLLRYPVGHAA